MTRLWIFLGIFAIAFPVFYWWLKREQAQGVDPEESVERVNRWTIYGSSTAGIIIAIVILLAGLAKGNLLIIAAAIALIAIQLWRRSTA